ncbi:hypothetical protein [Halocatena salina]|uniref:Uncharacterized protein n=1 Tax=Halocatena salina TaxID=2934340 RepID=A0A8U0AA56_9EURY|nr:hypothetical protein [Halocatena salina]UPM44697.1 hypothetical protein MW046_16830 [Halocatena salina]
MGTNDPTDESGREALSPATLTKRIGNASIGDELLFNDHDEPLEIVDTDRYSVTVVDSRGNRYTISQNLQSGEWNVHQRLWWMQVRASE